MNEKIIKTKELLEALNYLSPGIGKGAFNNGKYVLFTKKYLLTYNGSILIKYPMETNITGMLDYSTLINILNNLESDIEELIFVQKETSLDIITKDKKIKISFAKEELKEDKELEQLNKIFKKIKWEASFPTEIKKKILLSAFCASTDYTQPEYTGVYVSPKYIMSGSDYRIITFKNKEAKGLKDTFLLPATSALHLNKFNIKKYEIHKNWIYFKTKNNILIGMTLLPYQFFPKEDIINYTKDITKKDCEEFPKKLNNVLKRALIFQKEFFDLDRKIRLTFTRKKLVVKAVNETTSFIEELPCKLKSIKEKVIIETNPNFIIEALKYSGLFKFEKEKLIILSEQFIHLVNLVFYKKNK